MLLNDPFHFLTLATHPNQSLPAYLERCRKSLPETVKRALQHCTNRARTINADSSNGAAVNGGHTLPFHSIPSNPPVAVQQSINTELGTAEYRVVAARPIRKGELIGFMGGLLTLFAPDSAGTDRGIAHHPHVVVTQRALNHWFAGYAAPHSLVLSMRDVHNAFRYLRDWSPRSNLRADDANVTIGLHLWGDASDHSGDRDRDREVSAHANGNAKKRRKSSSFRQPANGNVAVKIPFIYLTAVKAIEPGHELLVHTMLEPTWQSPLHRSLEALARFNHAHHAHAIAVEQRIQRSGATDTIPDFYAAHPSNGPATPATSAPAPTPINPEIAWDYLFDDQPQLPETTAAAASPPLTRARTRPVSLSVAMRESGCEHCPRTVTDDPELGSILQLASDYSPPSIYEHDRHNDNQVSFSLDEIRPIVEAEYRADWIEVRELCSLLYPARCYAQPDRASFGVFALRSIPAFQLIATYPGTLLWENPRNHSTYSFEINRRELKRMMPTQPWKRSVHIDGATRGGLARFLNDVQFRSRHSHAHEFELFGHTRTRSVDVAPVILDGMVHLMIFTTRRVAANEELLLDYGKDYWESTISLLLAEHQRFYHSIVQHVRQLARVAQRCEVAVPAIQRVTERTEWCGNRSTSTARRGRQRIAGIVNVRSATSGSRGLEYCVQLVHSAQQHWVHERDMDCVALLAEFKKINMLQ